MVNKEGVDHRAFLINALGGMIIPLSYLFLLFVSHMKAGDCRKWSQWRGIYLAYHPSWGELACLMRGDR